VRYVGGGEIASTTRKYTTLRLGCMFTSSDMASLESGIRYKGVHNGI
jgi:hypothetical protein